MGDAVTGPGSQRLAPGALVALKRALTAIYWYKPDLRGFLRNALDDPTVLSRLDWEDYKRNIVGTLVDHLASGQPGTRDTLLQLLVEVGRMDDFSHLQRLDDGADKVAEAKDAVAALRVWTTTYESDVAQKGAADIARAEAREAAKQKQAVHEATENLKNRFYELVAATNAQKRGTDLERLMRDLFELYDLAPRAAFTLRGEQIDGAFDLDHTPYLFEAKWTQDRIQPKELRDFAGKIEQKLENTLGLFLSVNGFTDAAVESQNSRSSRMLLMDGSDLTVVLDRGLDLVELLRAKRRHASQTGEVLMPATRLV